MPAIHWTFRLFQTQNSNQNRNSQDTDISIRNKNNKQTSLIPFSNFSIVLLIWIIGAIYNLQIANADQGEASRFT